MLYTAIKYEWNIKYTYLIFSSKYSNFGGNIREIALRMKIM